MTLAIGVIAAFAGPTIAGHLTAGVKSYTGCLVSKDGVIIRIKEGNSPTSPCSGGQVAVHFSGGDITRISVTGALTGGGNNGEVTIGLKPEFTLPTGCTAGEIAEWDGSAWACGIDDDTTYTAGTGLGLSGTTFSVAPDYRVKNTPNCAAGQFATGFASDGTIQCGTQSSAPLAYFAAADDVRVPDDGALHEIVRVRLPAGTYAVTVTGEMRGADLGDESRGTCYLTGPSLFRPNGYSANVTTGGGVIAITRVVTLSADGSVFVQCTAISAADQADAESMEIVAITVG
ncbi:MAG: hypothetical protein A2V85_16970 [Chloroflexi bacterium RBG_16_72_14]|nr:MAG: hypothetical protein A2V85_16970 [Chloroflexi bacterium RBG_16_72_14]